MGFCSSYGEVLRFEKNAADCVAPDMLGEDIDMADTTLLFAADNVDHNVLTIDGKGTFHGMGMIGAMTPGQNTKRIIPRRNTLEVSIAEKTKVEIIEHRFSSHAHRNINFQELSKYLDCDRRIDILWELSFNFKQATPNWQGMMHTVHRGSGHPGQSSVVYLPIIDMYSRDKTCILSTLEFLSNLAIKYHVVPIITFDQPLYWKAAELIIDAPQNNLKKIVLMLGCFHTFMNLLGAIGTLMEGTGLQSILEVIHGANAVVHMMTGKSVLRSFRGHLLVEKCLNHMIVSDMVKDSPKLAKLVDESEEMYYSLLVGEMTLESILTSDTMTTIKLELDQMKTKLHNRSKTSQLWINYQKMLQIARSLIKADRTGSWLMHLSAVSDCLPIFAAAGYYNYLRSAYFYVQEMSEFESVGRKIMEKMIGQPAFTFSFKQKDKAKTLGDGRKFTDSNNVRNNAAPDILLKMIHCNCTTACTTLRCSCRRYGLPCHTVCGQCQLDECNNPYNQRTEEENDSE